jgi:hypothetical protein
MFSAYPCLTGPRRRRTAATRSTSGCTRPYFVTGNREEAEDVDRLGGRWHSRGLPSDRRLAMRSFRRILHAAVASVVLMVAWAPVAAADLSRHDPKDAPTRLDLRRVTSTRSSSAFGMTLEMYRAVPYDQGPRALVFYDAFGTAAADFVLRFKIFGPGMISCQVHRLADGRRLSSTKGDDAWRYLYCEFPPPPRMRQHVGIRWKVAATVPGSGTDYAPNLGWYRHV